MCTKDLATQMTPVPITQAQQQEAPLLQGVLETAAWMA